jgi:hypothetical protein
MFSYGVQQFQMLQTTVTCFCISVAERPFSLRHGMPSVHCLGGMEFERRQGPWLTDLICTLDNKSSNAIAIGLSYSDDLFRLRRRRLFICAC